MNYKDYFDGRKLSLIAFFLMLLSLVVVIQRVSCAFLDAFDEEWCLAFILPFDHGVSEGTYTFVFGVALGISALALNYAAKKELNDEDNRVVVTTKRIFFTIFYILLILIGLMFIFAILLPKF